MEKIFKTLDEQITILRNKNLIIDDVDYVKEIISLLMGIVIYL